MPLILPFFPILVLPVSSRSILLHRPAQGWTVEHFTADWEKADYNPHKNQ